MRSGESNNYGFGLENSEFVSNLENSTLKKLSYSNISLGLSFSYIANLKCPYIHYRCPKCYNFPLIRFLDREKIAYKCACIDRKSLKIKDLFNKENKYMTFLKDSKANKKEIDEIENINENIGLKCISHKNKNKFRYYCINCNENLCKECIQNHIFKQKEHYFLHDIIILDFQNIEILQKLKGIENDLELEKRNKIKKIDQEISKTINDKNISSILDELDKDENSKQKIEKYKLINQDSHFDVKPIDINIEEIDDYFVELINIIINDYLNFPNYYHFYNLENIYRYYFYKNIKNRVLITYKNEENREIKIFGEKFVKQNLENFFLIIEEKTYTLKGSHKFKTKRDYVEVNLIQKNKIENISYMFDGCKNLESAYDISKWDTSNVTDMNNMFFNCSSIKSLPDISKWNIIKVTNMSSMFKGCDQLQSLPDISKWNTSNITNMKELFYECKSLISLPDISKWNTNLVKDMSYMFGGCTVLKSLPDISKWNTSNAIDISQMFEGCKSLKNLTDISMWNTNNVTNLASLFCGCESLESLPDISKWNTSNVTNMTNIFFKCESLISLSDISKWNSKNFIDMSNMFEGCKSLKIIPDISKWNTHKVTNFSFLFSGNETLISLPDISKWNTNNVTNMRSMFEGCKSLKILPDISKWNVNNVLNHSDIFRGCKSLKLLPKIKWEMEFLIIYRNDKNREIKIFGENFVNNNKEKFYLNIEGENLH